MQQTVSNVPDWARTIGAAVTVCDAQATIVFMNEKAERTFAKWGGPSLIGKSLFDCHTARSQTLVRELLKSGRSNSYTIEKAGIKKLIHQTPWFENGKVAGLVEISIELPHELPHFVRT